MDELNAREELGVRLIIAEQELKAAEEEYKLFLKQLEQYKKTIDEHKMTISLIRSKMGMPSIQ
ncbi:hypothetical protein GC093_33320 [Paenibacillus sp. LMG 31456]|uniref:Uncharacterized protein n=1 Tax=Paenibacillus foliorum TaxID=2654974 RepID=A0A972GXR0_9BACL|nr:hypothetical protein [Paenibacillus foliorum]NOU98075.1 hypothetical protein [Paenibacillus foliorum]